MRFVCSAHTVATILVSTLSIGSFVAGCTSRTESPPGPSFDEGLPPDSEGGGGAPSAVCQFGGDDFPPPAIWQVSAACDAAADGFGAEVVNIGLTDAGNWGAGPELPNPQYVYFVHATEYTSSSAGYYLAGATTLTQATETASLSVSVSLGVGLDGLLLEGLIGECPAGQYTALDCARWAFATYTFHDEPEVCVVNPDGTRADLCNSVLGGIPITTPLASPRARPVQFAIELDPASSGPMYVQFSGGENQPPWVTLWRGAERVWVQERCEIADCDAPSAVCGASVPIVLDLSQAPNRRIEFSWDRKTSMINLPDYCETRVPAATGTHTARFCYSQQADIGQSGGSGYSFGSLVNATCESRSFVLAGDFVPPVVLRIAP